MISTELLPLVLLVASSHTEAVTEFKQDLSEGSVLVLSTHASFDGSINGSGGTVTSDAIMLKIWLRRGQHQK